MRLALISLLLIFALPGSGCSNSVPKDIDSNADADADADTDADADADTDADADADTDADADADADTGEADDTGTPADPPEGLGICLDLGSDGEGEGSGPVLQCLKPTGSDWDLTGWKLACESHWDRRGVWAGVASCPPESRIARCAEIDGGYLIGASFDGMSYAGTWVYYSTEYTLDTAEAHCSWARGTWVPD